MSITFCMPPTKQKLTHTWFTAIQKTITGIEKRSRLYNYPRISMTYEYTTANSIHSNYIRNRLKSGIKEIWDTPVFSDRSVLSIDSVAGTNTITVTDIGNRHFYVGREAILVNPHDWTLYEKITISNITDDVITTDSSLSSNWVTGSNIYPVYSCRIDPEQSINKVVIQTDTFNMEFKQAYSDINYTDVVYNGTTYSGLDVLTIKPVNSFSQSFIHPYNVLGFLGVEYSESLWEDTETEISGEYNYSTYDNADVRNILDFFDAHKGRLTPFWYPSWNKDIIIIDSSITAGQTTFNTIDNDWADNYGNNSNYGEIGQHIIIWLNTSNFVIRKIVSGTNSTITLDEEIGDVSIPSNLYISYLIYSRFDTDNIIIEHVTENISTFKLGFVGLVMEGIVQ